MSGRTQVEWATLLRRGLLALCGAGIASTALELASLRHWEGVEQKLPWAFLVVLVLALIAAASGRALTAARVASLVVLAGAAYGVVSHVRANEHAGPLDRRYETTWSGLSAADRWWKAVSGAVGPSPTLAPAALAFAALTLALGTAGRPRADATR